jgi:hypothetical protein
MVTGMLSNFEPCEWMFSYYTKWNLLQKKSTKIHVKQAPGCMWNYESEKSTREREREIGVLLRKQLENNPEEKQFTKKLCATNAM